jgi:type IV secretory pathway TraG/TraD family ATPase VirD4
MSRGKGPEAGGGSLVAELLIIGVGGFLIVLAGALWVPVALARPPGYEHQNPIEVPVGLARGQIDWSLACTLIAAGELVLLTLLVIAGIGGWSAWRRRRTRVDHAASRMGRGREVDGITAGTVARNARRLRPSLHDERRVSDTDAGVVIGDAVTDGRPLLQSWEDMAVDIWGPRTGKTTARAIPAIVDAPGPVLVTSVKGDVVDATRDVRAEVGDVWVFDPQGMLDGAEPAWWWNPLTGVGTITAARRLASHFAAAERNEGDKGDAYFDTAGEELVACLLLAAAASRVPSLMMAYRWLMRPDDELPIQVLRRAGHDLSADSLAGVKALPERTRGSVYAVARKMMMSLAEPSVTRWVTPQPGERPRFDTEKFVTSRDTLYLLSAGGAGSPAALIAAFTDAVLLAGERASARMPGRRLDPPLLGVLDECANIVKIKNLPDLYSHFGSRGLSLIGIFQSPGQIEAVWGEEGLRKLWSAANIITYGGGVKDDQWLEGLSRLIGEHDVDVRSKTQDSRSLWSSSTQVQPQRRRILEVADLAALPRGRMVVLASGAPAVLARTRPWQQGPHADAIRASLRRWEPGAAPGIAAPSA